MLAAVPFMADAQSKKYHGNNNGYNNGGYNNGYNNGRGGYNNGYNMQGVAGSALSVFSETGERFYLILNGVKQNMYAQSRVRIEGLPQVVNDVQIIFDDNRTPAINRTITFMDPVEGDAVNLTMKITRDRNGYARLAFHRLTSLERDYRGEQGEYIMYYGRDNVRPGGGSGGFTTTAPTQVVPPAPPPPVAMDPVSFSDALKAIRSSSFDDTKLSTAKTIGNQNYFTTDQVMTICKLFSFSDTKLNFAKFAYSRTVDYQNYYKVASVFSFDSDRKALNDFINAQR